MSPPLLLGNLPLPLPLSSSTLVQDKHSESKTVGPGEKGPVCASGHAGSIPQSAWVPRHQDSNFFSLLPPEVPG